MESHNDVMHQMEKIRYIFQHALYISTEQEDLSPKDHLDNVDQEFRAVAYEGIAMGLAVKDFADRSLKRWRNFVRSSDACYAPHVHVGLGWAAAKQRLSSLMFLDILEPLMLARVFDGLGYYEGTFRAQQALTKKIYPDCVQAENFAAFDQGLGRSLWYSAQGNVEKIKDAVKSFEESRQAHLWRGVGVAAVFVGKYSENQLYELLEAASINKIQLGIGAAIVANARISTGTLSEDVEQACRMWCNVSADKAMKIIGNVGSQMKSHQAWLDGMETELSAVIFNLS
jgi:hypothetical protein